MVRKSRKFRLILYGKTSFNLTAEDFETTDGAELSFDELEQVAGGWCHYAASGGLKYPCPCSIVGQGLLH